MLRLTPDVRDQMFAHALGGMPNESCGMFSSRRGDSIVDVFHPMRNAVESPVLFALEGQEMLDVERDVEANGRVLTGVMHSHTSTSPYPSPTDVRDAAKFDPSGVFQHVIVSLRHAEPSLRCFRITDQTITEEPVEIVEDGSTAAGGDGEPIAAVMRLPRP